jgi:hypothetical protein
LLRQERFHRAERPAAAAPHLWAFAPSDVGVRAFKNVTRITN